MASLVLAMVLAFVAALLTTPLFRRLAIQFGAVAKPVQRSVHTTPVPYFGGAGLYLAFALATLATAGYETPAVQGILLGGGLITLLGAIDDLYNIRPVYKILGQLAAAAALIPFGVVIEYINNPSGGFLYFGWLEIPITLFWVVAIINVMNLIDGLDGLAAGIGAIAAATLLISALQVGAPFVAIVMTAALLGSSLGFLPYNFNPAKIFMGDAGAMFLGFALAAVSVEGSLKSPTAVALAVPVLALGIPIFDTAFAIFRRWREGRPIAEADRAHIHHRLLELGLSHREVVLVMYMISGWLGIGAVAINSVGALLGTLILGFSVFSLYFGAKKMGIFDQHHKEVGS